MIDKISKYNGISLLKKENFDNVYNKLKTQNYHLLCSYKNTITNEDFANASTIVSDGKYFYWRHYGSSANKITKKDFKWLLQTIFNDCNYFTLIENNDYYKITDDYYTKLFNDRQKQLNGLEV